jgi:hypothetical protein
MHFPEQPQSLQLLNSTHIHLKILYGDLLPNILSRDWFPIDDRIYWTLWYSAWLQFTVLHTHKNALVSTVTSSVAVARYRLRTADVPLPLGYRTTTGLTTATLSQSRSQNYFTTGRLPPISSSWRQAIWDSRPAFFFNRTFAVIVLIQNPLWREDRSVVYDCYWPSPAQSFSWPHITISDSRLPQTGGPDPRICIPQEQGDPIIPSDTGFSAYWLFCFNILSHTLKKTPFHYCCIQLFCGNTLVCEALTYFIFAYLAVVAQQLVYMSHYVFEPTFFTYFPCLRK